jgi:ketosteroid isomerase-like protein
MRPAVTFATSILLLALTGQPAAQVHQGPSVESEIRQLHALLIEGYMHNDAGILNRVLADEYTFIDGEGRFLTKPHIVESFRSGDHHVFSYDMSEEALRVYGTAAVMTYRYVAKENYKGQDERGDYRITRVFAKKDGRWQIVAGQETRVSMPK